MEHTYDFNVFHHCEQPLPNSSEEFFFDINSFFEPRREDESFSPNLQRHNTDYFADGPQVEPFSHFSPPPPSHHESEAEEHDLFRSESNPFQESSTPVSPLREEKKTPPKSIATKNVCFNICQKTVKVIQKGIYATKLTDLCEFYGVREESFIHHILKQKKSFTGPKALTMYVESESNFSKVFRDFMRWFLREKYLRHCMTGDMKDKEAYIKYKNEVILVILD